MTNNVKMAPHVAAAIQRAAVSGQVQTKLASPAFRPAPAPRPTPPIHWPEPPAGSGSRQILQMAKKKAEKARNNATRVLGDFQAYGIQQYRQRLNQLIKAADCTQEQAIQLMVTWIMAHDVWKTKENLGHQSQRRGAPVHADTQREVDAISTNMENWITKKYG